MGLYGSGTSPSLSCLTFDSDQGNEMIRRVYPNGTIVGVVGSRAAYPLNISFPYLYSLAMDPYNRLSFSDGATFQTLNQWNQLSMYTIDATGSGGNKTTHASSSSPSLVNSSDAKSLLIPISVSVPGKTFILVLFRLKIFFL
jgi:hypothetical protein